MDKDQLELLLGIIEDAGNPAGLDMESLEQVIANEGLGVLYPLMPEGAVESPEELESLFPDLKKKDLSVLPGQTDPTAGSLGMESFNVSLDANLENPKGLRYGAGINAVEKDTAIERAFGKNFITDFFGDMYRAGAQGLGQGASVDDAILAYAQGSSMSDEAVQEYIDAVENMDSYGMSDEMKSFNNIYSRAGGGIWGFMSGVAQNPTVLPQLLISSFSAMMNPTVAAGAGIGAGLGAATGAATGAGVGALAGGIGAAPGAVLGAKKGAIFGTLMGAGATLETGLAFTEFMKEEVEKKGLAFDEEGVRAVLEDEVALQSIRNRAAGRGFTIGVIDGLTAGVAGKIGGKSIKLAKEANKAITKGMKAQAALKTAGIEAIGGGTGETAGRLVADQDLDVAEIGFEAITGTQSAVLSVPAAITGRSITEMMGVNNPGVDVFNPPAYGIKNKKGTVEKMTKEQLMKFIDTASPADIRTIQFSIVNDPELQQIVDDKKQAAQIALDLPSFLEGKDRAESVKLDQDSRNK